jgi:hypothetical protein
MSLPRKKCLVKLNVTVQDPEGKILGEVIYDCTSWPDAIKKREVARKFLRKNVIEAERFSGLDLSVRVQMVEVSA